MCQSFTFPINSNRISIKGWYAVVATNNAIIAAEAPTMLEV